MRFNDMALNESERKLLSETHNNMIKIKTVLLGTNGDEGLCGDVKQNTKSIRTLYRTVWIIVGIIITLSAIFGSSIISIEKLASG